MSAIANKTNGSKTPSESQKFNQRTKAIATSILTEWVGPDRAREATGRIAAALSASAAAAKKPEEFYACTPMSVATCVAISALTGIMPGLGSHALAYLIPRRARKGEPPQLQYQMSHRGLNALAKRCGQVMIPEPISESDELGVDEGGAVYIKNRDIDNPPTTFDELRGIMLTVKDLATGRVTTRQWFPKKLIEARREKSDSYRYAVSNDWAQKSDPWHVWPVEMAMKTAMHYAISRGWCVVDDTEAVRALSVDSDGDFTAAEMQSLPEPDERKTIEGKIREAADNIDAPAEWEIVLGDVECIVTEHPDADEVVAAMNRLEQTEGVPDAERVRLRDVANKRLEELEG